MKNFDTILIANRGEIACRIIRTAKAMGFRTVAVYSDADQNALHVEAADVAVHIGASASAQSYLQIEKIINTAKNQGAGAIHPGYGFLSENAAFAERCVQEGLIFIGPSAHAIRIMGDKAESKRQMLQAGVPCIPGYQGADQNPVLIHSEAETIGYPIMIKAAAGGGGKGMRLVQTSTAFLEALNAAKAEAMASFGSDTVLIEKALINPRHIEIQVFADEQGHTIHLGERDCSIQRRHQKILEEAPSPAVTSELREKMGAAAVAAARAVQYRGAGTVEFLLSETGEFYFLEMNTRLQVEHPITEMITGIDLVSWQIQVAQGMPLPLLQEQVKINGHAIEVRLYTEDCAHDFLPAVGRVNMWRVPQQAGLRVDSGVKEGGEISAYYDPMVAKVIAHGATREEARRKLLKGLRDITLFGPENNKNFLIHVLSNEEFKAGEATTAFIERHFATNELRMDKLSNLQVATAAAAGFRYSESSKTTPSSISSLASHRTYAAQGARYLVTTQAVQNSGLIVTVNDESYAFDKFVLTDQDWTRSYQGVLEQGTACVSDTGIYLMDRGLAYRLEDISNQRKSDAKTSAGGSGEGTSEVVAPMHGRIVQIAVKEGQTVTEGDSIVMVEAMKMQHTLVAELSGVIRKIDTSVGEQVSSGQVLVEIAKVGD